MLLLMFVFLLGFGITALKEQDRKIKDMIRITDEMEKRIKVSYRKESDIDRLYEKMIGM